MCEGDELFGPKSKQGNTHEMKAKTTKAALFAAITGLVFAAFAANFDLPTPPPSPFPDTESSVNVAVTNWPGLGRRIQLILSAHATPSNCVQLSFGQDTNADGDLAPEETHIVLGVDRGEPFARSESKFRVEVEQWNLSTHSAGQPEQEANHHCSPSPSTFVFRFKQPSAVAKRCTHAKITTRGRGDSAAQIAAEVTRPGVALFIR